MPKITNENCLQLCEKEIVRGGVRSKARAWNVAFELCIQNGMRYSTGRAGIEMVVEFINKKCKDAKRKVSKGK